MKPLTVEILAYAPTAYFHCQTCEFVWHQAGMGQKAHCEQMANNLPHDVMDDYRRLSDWIIDLVRKHGERLIVRVIDVASIEGFLKSLRYGVRRYPAVIIGGGRKLSPADFTGAEMAIEQQLAAQAAAAWTCPAGGGLVQARSIRSEVMMAHGQRLCQPGVSLHDGS